MQPSHEACALSDRYVLLTGATGLLGQYLLHDLMRDGHLVAVVVRGGKNESATQRVERIMQHWERQEGHPLPRPVVLSGDINQPNLGLDASAQRWVRTNCDRILHCAASLTFQEYKGEPRRTNVGGTQHVVDFCLAIGLDDMHYISTAYVCGKREDVVLEDELDVGQEFRNDYERSKFDAELIVRRSPAFKQLTVYRPVVITGDSRTGYTSTYHGAYLYMKLASVLAQHVDPDENGFRHVPVRWGAKGDVQRNITTVDWNSTIICQLFKNPAAHGRTFHLAPAVPITMREIISVAAEYYKLTGIEFLGYKTKPDFVLSELERRLWANVSIYGAYDFMDPTFDTTNLQRFAPTPVSPRIDHDLAIRLIDYAQKDRWGKRPAPEMIEPEIRAEALLRGLIDWEVVDQDGGSETEAADAIVGLNVLGPGGGAFRLEFRDGILVRMEEGLPPHADADLVRAIPLTELLPLRGSAETHRDTCRELARILGIDLRMSAGKGDVRRPLAHPQGST